MGEGMDRRVALMMADGLEEIEGLTVADILCRAKIPCDLICVTGGLEVTSSHGIRIGCDQAFDDIDFANYDVIVLPGGMPGTLNLKACEPLLQQLRTFVADGRAVAAICAAPTVLAAAGVLDGRQATCYPGFEADLEAAGATFLADAVVVDGPVTTSRGMGTAIDFALQIVASIQGDDAADVIAQEIVLMR